MPKKIRELKTMLRSSGFVMRAGKGSHTVWSHTKIRESITVSGDDARPYQERNVREIIQQVEDKS